MKLALDVLNQILVTLWHVAPWLAVCGLVFALLSKISPCNQGGPWWEKKGLGTDLAYWIFVPIFTRYLRIWVTVSLTIWLFHINDGQKIADFYLTVMGPCRHCRCGCRPFSIWSAPISCSTGAIAPFISGCSGNITPYITRRGISTGSAQRAFIPLNLVFGVAAADIAALLCGISPDIFVVMGPVQTRFTVVPGPCQSQLDVRPLRYVIASPVFHRWHHRRKNLRPQLRRHAVTVGLDVRHLSHAGRRSAPRAMALKTGTYPKGFGRRSSIR